jgi:DNA-binding NtrC family response regulator
MTTGDSLSVLVVDEAAEILSFFSRLLDANGMRALLARNAEEAIRIAKLDYVPIDLVMTDVFLKPDDPAHSPGSGLDLAARLREWRPDVRVLFMSAFVDSGMIRIELQERRFGVTSKTSDDPGLIESIRAAIAAPLERSWHIAAATPGNRIS